MSLQHTRFHLVVLILIVVLSSCFISSLAIKCFGYGLEEEIGTTSVGNKPVFLQQVTDHHRLRPFLKWFECFVEQEEAKRAVNRVFNVHSFGAKGDGKTDDSKAFMKAWKMACSTKHSTLLVPAKKKYYLKPITLKGPCKGVTINIQGTIIASKTISDYAKNRGEWIEFKGVKGISVYGGGTFDGNGEIWWAKSCKRDKTQPCKHAPTAVTFADCTNVKVDGITVKNAQQMHLTFHSCVNVQASNININSPGNSPNTDGIHISGTKNIVLNQCDIRAGDDCISIVNGSDQVQAQNIKCGPGHGISVGSLGKNGAHDIVSNIKVDKATISNTQNGVRIKTWQGGSGIAENIVFTNIVMNNVTNPIIIDQHYCDKRGKPCTDETQNVQVKNVVYKNIKGTSARKGGVIFKCSKSVPCEGIMLQNIDLVYKDHTSIATCINAKVQELGHVSPSCPKSQFQLISTY